MPMPGIELGMFGISGICGNCALRRTFINSIKREKLVNLNSRNYHIFLPEQEDCQYFLVHSEYFPPIQSQQLKLQKYILWTKTFFSVCSRFVILFFFFTLIDFVV